LYILLFLIDFLLHMLNTLKITTVGKQRDFF